MSNWINLREELDRWQRANQTVEFWWRDDDAETATENLIRLRDIGKAHDVTPALAVSPALVEPALIEITASAPSAIVLQHGFAHANHAPPEKKKCELGDDRAVGAIEHELTRGLDKMRRIFGDSFLPVMVPPWNRISEVVLSRLKDLGFVGISTYTARQSAIDHDLTRYNTHIDIIDWKQSRRFAGLVPVLDLAIAHLSHKRTGRADAGEPTGLLTHHLQHDNACWEFIDEFLDVTRRHPAVKWVSARDMF